MDWSFRGVVIKLIILGVILWVIHNPSNAGDTVGGWINWAIGAGQSIADAIITVIQSVT